LDRGEFAAVTAPEYGFLWWLDTNKAFSVFSAAGLGGNLLLVDPERDLIVVMRWIEMVSRDKVLKIHHRVSASVEVQVELCAGSGSRPIRAHFDCAKKSSVDAP
jgi:hypothetical protein